MPHTSVNIWPLIGVAAIAFGFAFRLNAMLVVTISAAITAAAAGLSVHQVVGEIGAGFLKARTLPILMFFPLTAIGILEREGLRERAQAWIAGIKAATVGRILIVYLLIRQLTTALGLGGLGGHAQMVRPLLAPMVEGAADTSVDHVSDRTREHLRSWCAATDNVGLFFGQDIFIAYGAVTLMVTFLHQVNIEVVPARLALWGIPSAFCGFTIHALRLRQLDRRLSQELPDCNKNSNLITIIRARNPQNEAPKAVHADPELKE